MGFKDLPGGTNNKKSSSSSSSSSTEFSKELSPSCKNSKLSKSK